MSASATHLRALRNAQRIAQRRIGNRVARAMLPPGRHLLTIAYHLAPQGTP